MLIELLVNILAITSLFDSFCEFFLEFCAQSQLLVDHKVEVVTDGFNFRVIHRNIFEVANVFGEEPLDRKYRNTFP